jgi:hypothetical protein
MQQISFPKLPQLTRSRAQFGGPIPDGVTEMMTDSVDALSETRVRNEGGMSNQPPFSIVL